MRPRTALVSLLAAAMLFATAAPAAAGGKHKPSGPKPGGGGVEWSDPGPVDVVGRIGSDAGKPDALRYVGHARKHKSGYHDYSDDYIRADPHILTAPENGPVTITGMLGLSNSIGDTVGAFGLVERSALKKGDAARDTGALLYLFTRDDGSLRIGLSDGRQGAEIVQVFREIPSTVDELMVTMTIDGTADPTTCVDRTNTPPPTTGGCMTLVLEGATPVEDNYGTIKAAVDEEFLDGAVPGWEMLQGQDTGIGYDLTISPARTRIDAHQYPKSKRDCKNGGYAEYGFRNQGQCVRWVVRRRHHHGHSGHVGHWKPSHHEGQSRHARRRGVGGRQVHWGPFRHGEDCQW